MILVDLCRDVLTEVEIIRLQGLLVCSLWRSKTVKEMGYPEVELRSN